LILLDTHIVVWLALDPGRLSAAARSVIEESRQAGQGVAVSDITLFEISVLHRKGRISLNAGLESFLAEIEMRFAVLPITARACVSALALPAAYPKDPADRIIGGTALAAGVPLVTADEEIRNAGAVRTIW
jgi:PIN domain nuclease of toxin-antitoxin system